MDFGALIQTLENEVDIYKEFVEIEGNKSIVIANGEVERLDTILNTEHMLHMKAQAVEKKRMEIMKSLNLEEKTLINVIDIAEGEAEKEKLTEILDDLTAYTDSLKQINEYNIKLVKARLEIVSSVANLFKEPAGAGGNNNANNSNISNINVKKSGGEKIYGKNAKVVEQPGEYEPPMINKKI